MNKIKFRMELQLEAGDLVKAHAAIGDALEAAAVHMHTAREELKTDIVEVPRGQMAYMIEAGYHARREEEDNGA